MLTDVVWTEEQMVSPERRVSRWLQSHILAGLWHDCRQAHYSYHLALREAFFLAKWHPWGWAIHKWMAWIGLTLAGDRAHEITAMIAWAISIAKQGGPSNELDLSYKRARVD